jgi:hypothetical protein
MQGAVPPAAAALQASRLLAWCGRCSAWLPVQDAPCARLPGATPVAGHRCQRQPSTRVSGACVSRSICQCLNFPTLPFAELQPCMRTRDLHRSLVMRIGPGYPLHTAELVNNTHLVLRQFRAAAAGAAGRGPQPCAAAAAAASVSAGAAALPTHRSNNAQTTQRPLTGSTVSGGRGGSGGGGGSGDAGGGSSGVTLPLGTSTLEPARPTFHEEVLQYMSQQVAPPRGAARRRQRAAARAASGGLGAPGVTWCDGCMTKMCCIK